jgi:hypothetical protein
MRQDVLVPLWPRKREGYRSAAELVRDLRRALSLSESEAARGQLAGLTSNDGSAPFRRECEMSDVFRGGVLAGRLYRRLLDERHRLDGQIMQAAAAYGASIAQSVAEGGFDAPDTDVLLKEHSVGCIRATRYGCEFDEASEQVALGWLADELGVPLTHVFLVRWHDLRERRIARVAED